MDKDDELKNWYLRAVKVAVAVAVIKSSPPGRSGRQQAEYLAAKLKSQAEDWEAKARGLQVEVLHLRQELLLSKVLSKSSCDGAAAGDTGIDPLSLDLVSSAKDTPSWDKDSGCGTRENTEVLPPAPDLGEGSSEPVLARPGLFGAVPSAGTTERAVLLHTQFLQNLVGLARLEGEDQPEAWVCPPDRDCSVVSDSICQLLSCIASACGDPQPLLPAPLLLQAARVTARAVDHGSSGRLPSTRLMTQVKDSLKELADLLLNNSWLNRFHMQETLADCLVLLGGSSLLKPLLIGHVLCQINCFADQLWETCQRQDESEGHQHWDASGYENSFYLLSVLERLLQGAAGESRAGHGGQLARLKQRALQLSDEFALFALYAWRVATETAETPNPR